MDIACGFLFLFIFLILGAYCLVVIMGWKWEVARRDEIQIMMPFLILEIVGKNVSNNRYYTKN